jgi:hypothetical protein
MGGALSCPAEFVVAPSGTACLVPCPEPLGYTMTSQGSVLSCTYTGDSSIKVTLTPTPMYMTSPGGQGRPAIPARASYTTLGEKPTYQAELDRFAAALAVANGRIDRAVRVNTAFSQLQAAENARGTTAGETAYSQARIAYYTLTQGDSWLATEQERIANTEAQPVVNSFVSQYNNLKAKRTEQQSTIEVINGLKDKVLSVKDDMAFSVKTFQKQMDAINNQINIDKKNQEDAIQLTSSWIDVFLNWVIAIITLLCIVFLVRRFAGSVPTIEKLKSEASLLRARAELSRAKAGLPTPPTFLSSIFGTPAASTAASK